MLSCVLCFSTIVSPCSAREVLGVTFPDTQTIQGIECKLNGVGVRKKLIINIYLGTLYTAKPSKNASEIITSEQVKRVVMHFLYKEVKRSNSSRLGMRDSPRIRETRYPP